MAIHEDEAAEYSSACYDDVARDHLQGKLAQAADTITRQAAEIERLKEALKPFAEYAEAIGLMLGPSGLFNFELESHVIGRREVTEDDFRRARRALDDAGA